MDKVDITPNLIKFVQVPKLEFGTYFITNNNRMYELANDTTVIVKDINYKKWQLNLSIGDLTNGDGNKLNANYIMNNTSYNTKDEIPYYSYNNSNNNIDETINITKKPNDNIKMYFPSKNESGDYNGTATWNLVFTPVNNNSGSDSGYNENDEPSTYSGDKLKSYLNGRLAGRNDGFNTGKQDASNGENYKQSYNDSHDGVDKIYKVYKQGYKSGYSDGYSDGYYYNNSDYNDNYSDGYYWGTQDGRSNNSKNYLSGYNGYYASLDGYIRQTGYKNGYDEGYDSGYKQNSNDNTSSGY